MSETDYQQLFKLTTDIAAAKAAAETALLGKSDGGSCNTDEAFIRIRPTRKRFAAIVAGGLHPRQQKGGYALAMHVLGQGARVTIAADTIAETLRTRGWDATVKYHVD